ncbi:MAG TPA: nitroreductase [Geobacteraceae bacterium]|nr:nitroreductase [Geobacteraceae bacterium]
MELLEGIFSRRSVRNYSEEPVSANDLQQILLAGSQAPSGLNNQPWRFVVIRSDEVKNDLAALTRYRRIVSSAPLLIAVFIDREAIYNEVKDHQGIGACIQNMLLAAHGLGLGAVWLGEILRSAEEVRVRLGVADIMELMAVVAVGHPAGQAGERTGRKPLGQLLLKEL